jgi:hypothetical protein
MSIDLVLCATDLSLEEGTAWRSTARKRVNLWRYGACGREATLDVSLKRPLRMGSMRSSQAALRKPHTHV